MMDHSVFSRRKFLKGIAASGLGAGALATQHSLGMDSAAKAGASGKVRNVILMVSDGMNHGTLSAANHWLNLRENRESEWMMLYHSGLATRRLCETACANSLVTDSAAASSAWGIGQRVNMGAVNTTPDGKSPEPIGVLAKKKGKSVGMVTTARITHATPAGFAANVEHRNQEDRIAEQYLERRLDVLLGGGDEHFAPELRADGRDLYAAYQQEGYAVVKTRDALLGVKDAVDTPLLGVFSKDHLPYCLDRMYQRQFREVPSLETLTEVALKRLSTNPEGFLLQIEAGRVDHAGHANDPASILHEQLEFDRTIAIVRAFAEGRNDTLVVVTTDHGTGGFMLCGADDGYHHAQPRFEGLFRCMGSHEQLHREVSDLQDSDLLLAAIERNYGFQLETQERESVLAALERPVEEGIYHAIRNLTEALNPIFFRRFSVSWNCANHTGDLVELAMFGPGSNILPAYTENWQLHGLMCDLLGV